MSAPIRSRYIDMPWGQIHVRGELEESDKPAVLLLHQNPLSIVTYEQVLRPMSAYCRPIAVDTPGFGMSDPPPERWSIEQYGKAIENLSNALRLKRPVLLGQHTGACISIDVALRTPDQVTALILIGVPCVTAEEAAARLSAKGQFTVADDGSHLQFLWERMQGQYPGIDSAIATRHIVDHLLAGPAQYLDAYRAVYTYPILDKLTELAKTSIPVLLLSGSGDCIKHLHDRTSEFLPDAALQTLDGLTDFAMDEDPAAFAAAVESFLRDGVAAFKRPVGSSL